MSGGAEAVLSMEPNSSVSVLYHPSFGSHNDIFLLEVDESILPDFLHQRITLRGELDEDAVACTRSKTYGIKFVGTSNSPLLVPPLALGQCQVMAEGGDGEDAHRGAASVIVVASGSMELFEAAPRLQKLKLLLSESPYNFEGEEEMTDGTALYSWDDLAERIQASDEELKDGLRALLAVEINGYWRSVDPKLMDLILRMLLHNSVLNGWSLGGLNEAQVVDTLASDGFIPQLSRHCLCVYGNKIVGEAGSKWGTWKLDEKLVCVHFAREILRAESENKKKVMMMNEFMEEWSHRVPRGMEVNFEMLEGEVLVEKIGTHNWVYGFSVSSLPSTPAECFSVLFQHRPKWNWKDLHPYIRHLRVPGLSSEALLLKYTRKSQPTQDAEPIFSAR